MERLKNYHRRNFAKRYTKKAQKRGIPYSLEELQMIYKTKQKFYLMLTICGYSLTLFSIIYILVMTV